LGNNYPFYLGKEAVRQILLESEKLKDIQNVELKYYLITESLMMEEKKDMEKVISEVLLKNYIYDYPKEKEDIKKCLKDVKVEVREIGTKDLIQEKVLKQCFIEKVKEIDVKIEEEIIKEAMKRFKTVDTVVLEGKKTYLLSGLNIEEQKMLSVKSTTRIEDINRYTELKKRNNQNDKLLFVLVQRTTNERIVELMKRYEKERSSIVPGITIEAVAEQLMEGKDLKNLEKPTETSLNEQSLKFKDKLDKKYTEKEIIAAGQIINKKGQEISLDLLKQELGKIDVGYMEKGRELYSAHKGKINMGLGVAAAAGIGYLGYKWLKGKKQESSSSSSSSDENKSNRKSKRKSNRKSKRKSLRKSKRK
jgi:hypothetical protein